VCGGTPEQHRKEGLRRARQLVARHREQIIAVAEALLQRKRLTADEVREIIAQGTPTTEPHTK